MGYYINPQTMTKEEFLATHAAEVDYATVSKFSYPPTDKIPVVLVDNRAFTAAAIAYSPLERDEFLDTRDKRPKKYFLVPLNVLNQAAGLDDNFPDRIKTLT
jgi:hypothetical protein